MCGVAALIGNFNSASSVETQLESMTELSNHRGPDGSGHRYFNKVALGHRRLAILDLSAGGLQPMVYRQRYFLSFNGEIYNYRELKLELEKLGHAFKTQTDSEVILAAFAEWGVGCFQRFNGMWGLLIYDNSTGRVVISRDRYGVKPVYLWKSSSGNLAVASEIKQFTKLPGWNARLNSHIAKDFLQYGILDHTHETFFAGVRQLRGGEFLDLNSEAPLSDIEQLCVKRWYEMKINPFEGDFEEAKNEFRRLFQESIQLRLRSDVDVGTCLSGGLDSSSIVCSIDKLLTGGSNNITQKTFSAVSSHAKYDERKFIEIVKDATKIEAHFTEPDSQDLLRLLPDLIWHQDEPFGSTSIFAQWKVFELARKQGVKVVLDGQGADELLLGYPSFFPVLWASLLKTHRIPTLQRELRAAKRLHGYTFVNQLAKVSNELLPRRLGNLAKALSGSVNPAQQIINYPNDLHPEFIDGRRNNLQAASLSQILHTNLPMLLHWEDRNSMAHGVEARVPFLDYRLVELVISLPDHFKLRNGITKSILRESLQGILPREICTRMDKMGFVTPEALWFRGAQAEQLKRLCLEGVHLAPSLYAPDTNLIIERLLASPEHSPLPWRILCFGQWLKRFQVLL